MLQHHFQHTEVTPLDGVVKDGSTSAVLLERACPLVKQVANDLGEAAAPSIDERCAALWARLVDVSLAAGDQGSHKSYVALDSCTVERGEPAMVRCVRLQGLRQMPSNRRLNKQTYDGGEAMNHCDEKRRLAMLILKVGFRTTADQGLDDACLVVAASDVQRCG